MGMSYSLIVNERRLNTQNTQTQSISTVRSGKLYYNKSTYMKLNMNTLTDQNRLKVRPPA